jgi:hypothetical protein
MIASAAVTVICAAVPAAEPPASLPVRVRRLVVHVLGGPSYSEPRRRFVFFPPPETQARWKPSFGAHWIVWTDGTLWPRHAPPGQPAFRRPAIDRPADAAERRRLAAEAAPVYSHARGSNRQSVGIELAHSGRGGDPFEEAQVRTLAWLLRTLLDMSGGRLGADAIVGHKDVDRRPAYVRPSCEHPGCPVFADDEGRPYRRRVDPPEALFARLARAGLPVPRQPDGDAELRRAEAMGPGVPRTVWLRAPSER